MQSEAPFDRELGLAELLGGGPGRELERCLNELLGPEWSLVAADDSLVLGSGWRGPGHDIVHEGEPMGRLMAPDAARAGTAIGMLQLLARANQRYRMAIGVHEAAVAEDYAALQRQHAELERSEARYRALSEQLEQRVTEQVATIESAQRQLYQAERMASVGQLAAGMAHEINNPIGFVRSNLASARQYLAQLSETLQAWRRGDGAAALALWQGHDLDFVLQDYPSLLDESSAGADRIARIVASLKAFSNVDGQGDAPFDPNESLRNTAAVAQSQVGAGQQLELCLTPVARLRGDIGQLNQVLLSLVQNALTAIGPQGRVQLLSQQRGEEVWLQVRDNGVGMDAATLARIFDPFFTTRAVGQGTGLGLTVSRDLVRGWGGRIEVDSRPGQGACFSIVLPGVGGTA